MAGKIIAIEDNDTDFMALSWALQSAGVKNIIERCDNGHAAADRLLSSQSDILPEKVGLIILDLNIPGVDGRQILRDFRAKDPRRTVPVIVLTASTLPRDMEECQRTGANAYVVKPLELEEWQSRIGPLAERWLADNPVVGVSKRNFRKVRQGTQEGQESSLATETLLARTVESEIIPRLMLSFQIAAENIGGSACLPRNPGAEDVAELTRLLVTHDVGVALAFVNVLLDQGVPRFAVFKSLIKPTTDLLGDFRDSDLLDMEEHMEAMLRLQDLLEQLTSDDDPVRRN